ncbi:MAG: glycosyltransferase family 4 protein [Planctomycetaceae bacterium]|jgi:N,N'-diacetylbacillosaminyl-diphospho-undecaprenol alpha-1,3-N-acetylgalactosaminyltransferase|nr:glycosyltransferase family 4 protein [Planctomycetaceae bacterium]
MKIAIISAVDFVPWQFRSEFIATLIYNGHDVTVISSKGPYVERLQAIGAKHIAIPLNRFISPLTDLLYLFRLYFTLRNIKPDIVYAMTAKPTFFAPIIAKCLNVPQVYNMYGGIGFIHVDGGSYLMKIIKRIARLIQRYGGKFVDFFIFQNHDDYNIFLRNQIITEKNSIVVNGSGVNCHEFNIESVNQSRINNIRHELGLSESTRIVLMVSRVAKNKGILEFINAGRYFENHNEPIQFLHAGSVEKGSLENVVISQIQETKNFKQIGFRMDIKDIISMSDIVVLPSYHREGIPNTLLEAMAMKKPIVTTNNVGCRDVVDDGINGFLIPIRDADALANAIEKLIDNPVLRKQMGEIGYEKIQRQFTVESINKIILQQVFQMNDIQIPDFYTEETSNGLFISLNGEQRFVSVNPISTDHVLN